MTFLSSVSITLSILTVIAQLFFIVLFFLFIFSRETLLNFINKYGLFIIFFVALISVLGSLFYSEIAKYDPCKLCWFQRIFMYPQLFLLGRAIIKKDKSIVSYTSLLSVLGILITAYHYLLQLGIAPKVPCSVVGYSISCTQRFVLEFGYITIPLMSFTAFALMLLVSIFLQKKLNK